MCACLLVLCCVQCCKLICKASLHAWGQGGVAEVVAPALDPLRRKVRVILTSWCIPTLYRKHILESMTYHVTGPLSGSFLSVWHILMNVTRFQQGSGSVAHQFALCSLKHRMSKTLCHHYVSNCVTNWLSVSFGLSISNIMHSLLHKFYQDNVIVTLKLGLNLAVLAKNQ